MLNKTICAIGTKSLAGYIYLLKSPEGHYKIGMTTKPKERFQALECQYHCELEVVRIMATLDRRRDESLFHALFNHHRQEGEWFSLDREDLSLFEQHAQTMEQLNNMREQRGYAQ